MHIPTDCHDFCLLLGEEGTRARAVTSTHIFQGVPELFIMRAVFDVVKVISLDCASLALVQLIEEL